MSSPTAGPDSVDAVARMLAALPELLADLVHDWQVLAEYDGAYTLHRCSVCRTELVR